MTTEQALVRNEAAPALVARGTEGARSWRLGIVKELLADLDIITVAGQHFTIEKVIKLLELEAAAAEPALSELQRRGVRKALADLCLERGRPLPQVDAFVPRAQMIVWTLSLV